MGNIGNPTAKQRTAVRHKRKKQEQNEGEQLNCIKLLKKSKLSQTINLTHTKKGSKPQNMLHRSREYAC